MLRSQRLILLSCLGFGLFAAVVVLGPMRGVIRSLWSKIRGDYTVTQRLEQFRKRVAERLKPDFDAAGVVYPPGKIAFVAFKDARILELYAARADGAWRFIKRYPILAASGKPGPKLREGDQQVPEGIYRVESLNPNSRFHLSLRLNYPNEFDRRMAKRDGRTNLGGDIMIHGNSVSIGCLAIGDEAAEDLFVLAALVGLEKIQVVICPTDFRRTPEYSHASGPVWVAELYGMLREELQQFPLEMTSTVSVEP